MRQPQNRGHLGDNHRPQSGISILFVEAGDGVLGRQRAKVFGDLHQAGGMGLESLKELGLRFSAHRLDDARDQPRPLGRICAAMRRPEEDLIVSIRTVSLFFVKGERVQTIPLVQLAIFENLLPLFASRKA